MPHARSVCESFEDFVELHYPQLHISGVPQKYWATLFNKLKNEVRSIFIIVSILNIIQLRVSND